MANPRRPEAKHLIAKQNPQDFNDFEQSVDDFLSISDLGPGGEWDNKRVSSAEPSQDKRDYGIK